MPESPPEKNADKKKTGYDKQRDQFLLCLNHPEKHAYSHETIKQIIRQKFKHVIFYCMADEIAETGTPHIHLYILLSKKKRWSAVQNAFPHAHIEAEVRGTPQQVVAYIKKESHSDKQHTQVKDSYEQWGELPAVLPTANKNEILLQIESLIAEDLKPEEIMEKSILFRQYENIIRKSFFSRRYARTPPKRDIEVYWHVGASGSGKSYTYVQLCEQYGADEVFFTSDFTNRCSALMDGYQSEKILFIDELKPYCMPYEMILQMLHGYRTQLHARFSNVYALYDEVHITSIYTPDEIYSSIVERQNQEVDSLYQLMRRITSIIYHYRDKKGYHTFEMPPDEFKSHTDLQKKAQPENDGFIPLQEGTKTPFDEPEKPDSKQEFLNLDEPGGMPFD
jgi:hypothetical protein